MTKKILVLAPHPDDAEFSSGGTLAKFIEQNFEIQYIVFSSCSKSLPSHLPDDILFKEQDRAALELGIELGNITKLDFPVREFPHFRQDILEKLISFKKNFYPDLVLLPNKNDIHQDHNTIYNEGIRAFKGSSMLGYELPWNNVIRSETNYFVKITSNQLNKKIKAISEYKSQSFRKYMDSKLFKDLARLRGTQIGYEFAEGFELIRWID